MYNYWTLEDICNNIMRGKTHKNLVLCKLSLKETQEVSSNSCVFMFRLIVIEELLSELDPDVYLWQFMVLVADQHVVQLALTAADADTTEVKIPYFAATKRTVNKLLKLFFLSYIRYNKL